jgi:hypothetical protein
LGSARFQRIAQEYIEHSGRLRGIPERNLFAEWLTEIQALVISECRKLWTGEWHQDWFARVCEGKIAANLRELARDQQKKIRRLEIKHLDNP